MTIHMITRCNIPYSGYFSGGGKFSRIWKILRVRGKNFVVSCTRALMIDMSVARCIYNYGNCFVGKYFVVYFSTTKTTKILTPEKYPLYGIHCQSGALPIPQYSC